MPHPPCPGLGGWPLPVLPPPLFSVGLSQDTPAQAAVCFRPGGSEGDWRRARHCHCPSGRGPHLDPFHAVLGRLGRHALDLWLEPLPAEGHGHVSTLLDLRSGQHTPTQVVGQACVRSCSHLPAAGAAPSTAREVGPVAQELVGPVGSPGSPPAPPAGRSCLTL